VRGKGRSRTGAEGPAAPSAAGLRQRTRDEPRARLLLEYFPCARVERIGLLGAVPHGGQSHAAALAQGGHHVEHYACLPGLVEVEPMPDDRVEQIIGCKGAIVDRFEMDRGDEVLRAAARRIEYRDLRIEGP